MDHGNGGSAPKNFTEEAKETNTISSHGTLIILIRFKGHTDNLIANLNGNNNQRLEDGRNSFDNILTGLVVELSARLDGQGLGKAHRHGEKGKEIHKRFKYKAKKFNWD